MHENSVLFLPLNILMVWHTSILCCTTHYHVSLMTGCIEYMTKVGPTSIAAGVDDLPCFIAFYSYDFNYSNIVQYGRTTKRSRRGPRNNITQKPASIFPDDNEAVLVR